MVPQPAGLEARPSGRIDGGIQGPGGSVQFAAGLSQRFFLEAGDILPSIPETFHAVAGGVRQTVHHVIEGGGGRHASLEYGVVARIASKTVGK